MNENQAKKWVDLAEWGIGMDEFKLPSSDELAGKELMLRLNANSKMVKYVFLDSKSLSWCNYEDTEKKPSEIETYEAIRIAPDIYFVDYVLKTKPNVSVSIALDLNTGKATIINAKIPDSKKIKYSFLEKLGKDADLSSVRIDIQHATIGPFSPDRSIVAHERTKDLVGKRIKYTYGRDRVYEHIYLNERFYTWHCLIGSEAGLGDTDICDCFKISPDIYLFSWREKIMPTYGLVLINLKDMRSNGKTFGVDIASGKYLNFTMGALAEFLNETKY